MLNNFKFLIVLLFPLPSFGSIQLNRDFTGVTFSAYVRQVIPGPIPHPDWQTYSLNDVTAMMEVMSTKFSNISTFGVGSRFGYQLKNRTRYDYGYSQKYSAEAAAFVNKEAISGKLSILTGIWILENTEMMENEVALTVETVQRANKIYPGTVWGVVFSENDIDTNLIHAKIAFEWLIRSRKRFKKLNLKVGTRQRCNGIIDQVDSTEESIEELRVVRQEILNNSDFIICILQPHQNDTLDDLLRFRNEFKVFELEVMGQTGYPTSGNTPEERQALTKYLKQVNSFASKYKVMMWWNEAFDNPWNQWNPKAGLWKLSNNQDPGNDTAYTDKTFEFENVTDTYSSHFSATIILVVVVLLLMQGIVVYMRFTSPPKILSDAEVNQLINGTENEEVKQTICIKYINWENLMLSIPYKKEFEFSKKNFIYNTNDRLGSGEFGEVYMGWLKVSKQKRIPVALKVPKKSGSVQPYISLIKEIKILSYLGNHPNLVTIKGAYTVGLQYGEVFLATELCELGSLKDYLQHEKSRQKHSCLETVCKYSGKEKVEIVAQGSFNEASASSMLRWSYEIACGMEYLEMNKVVHADLAARNVLLTSEKVAKITDFGLSRRLYEKALYINAKENESVYLPWQWMPPEVLQNGKFSSKADVWSYGVTLWEIFSMGDDPYNGMKNSPNFSLRLQKPNFSPNKMFNVMKTCWKENYFQRPTFSELKQNVESIMQSPEDDKEIKPSSTSSNYVLHVF